MIPKLLTLSLKPSISIRYITIGLHCLSAGLIILFNIHVMLKLIVFIAIGVSAYYTYRQFDDIKILQISQSGRASVLTRYGEWYLIQIQPETFCNYRLIILNFKYLEEHRYDKRKLFYLKPRRLILTQEVFEQDQHFRYLRIILNRILK